jgi:hypothetical protein
VRGGESGEAGGDCLMVDSREDEKWKLEIFRDKLRHSLGARFFLRFHVSLILVFSIVAGWGADWLLLQAGLLTMAIRYVLAIFVAYGAFLLGVYVWIEYAGIREYLNQQNAKLLVGDDVSRKTRDTLDRKDGIDMLIDPIGWATAGEGCMIVALLCIGFVVLFYFFGGFIWANAATFFADVVLELLLAGGLLRGIRRTEASGWVLGVVNSTYWSLMLTLTIALLFSWWAHVAYPGANTLPEVLSRLLA